MVLKLTTLEVPLRIDDGGTIRVGKTRVPIDTVIAQYHEGATPEQIVERFDALALVDVYGTITYYLAHLEEIDAYLQQRREESERIRRENEARFDNSELHARLLDALAAKKRHQADNS